MDCPPCLSVSISVVGAWVENVEAYAGLSHRLAGKINRVCEVARPPDVPGFTVSAVPADFT